MILVFVVYEGSSQLRLGGIHSKLRLGWSSTNYVENSLEAMAEFVEYLVT
jgi:hypothetical protein